MNVSLPDYFSDPNVIAITKLFRSHVAPGADPPRGLPKHANGHWLDAALEILNDKTGIFSNACSVVGLIPGLPFTPEGSDIRAQVDAHRSAMPWSEHLVCMDGKRHQELRMLLGSLPTYKRLKQNEKYLHSLADRLIDGFIDKGRCAVVPEYAHATTTYAISRPMGVPEGHRVLLLEFIGAPPSQVDGDAVQGR